MSIFADTINNPPCQVSYAGYMPLIFRKLNINKLLHVNKEDKCILRIEEIIEKAGYKRAPLNNWDNSGNGYKLVRNGKTHLLTHWRTGIRLYSYSKDRVTAAWAGQRPASLLYDTGILNLNLNPGTVDLLINIFIK